MLKSLTPNLMVDDVNQTVDWYRSLLGFDVVAQVPAEGTLDFVILRRDDVGLMLQSKASLTSDLPVLRDVPIGASQTFYIEVSDVDSLHRQLAGKVRIVKDLHDTFYGTREFYFADCNGYILSFSQSLETGA